MESAQLLHESIIKVEEVKLEPGASGDENMNCGSPRNIVIKEEPVVCSEERRENWSRTMTIKEEPNECGDGREDNCSRSLPVMLEENVLNSEKLYCSTEEVSQFETSLVLSSILLGRLTERMETCRNHVLEKDRVKLFDDYESPILE